MSRGRAFGKQLAAVQNDDPVREREYGVHVVLDDDEGRALLGGELSDQREHGPTFDRREPRRGLVEEAELRACGDRDPELQKTLVSMREHAGGRILLTRKADLLDERTRLGDGLVFAREVAKRLPMRP